MRIFVCGALTVAALASAGCTRQSSTDLSLPDLGVLSDAAIATQDAPNNNGDLGNSPQQPVLFRVSANITWAESNPFGNSHEFSLWLYDLNSPDSTPMIIGAEGTVASFLMRHDGGSAWSMQDTTLSIGFSDPATRTACNDVGPIQYKTFSLQITPSGSGYRVTGSATGSIRGRTGGLVYASDFTATLTGMTETNAPSVQYVAPATSNATLHPMDPFTVYFNEPLDQEARVDLVGGAAPVSLNRAGASSDNFGPFMRAYASDRRLLPWGATLHLEIANGRDLSGIAIDNSPASVTQLRVENDPGIYDELEGFDAETVNALLLRGAAIVDRTSVSLTGEGKVLFIPTGQVAIGDASAPTHEVGRATIRLPIVDTDAAVHIHMALLKGTFGSPSFYGQVQGVLPMSDRRVYFDTIPTFTFTSGDNVTAFADFTAPVGSIAASETELVLDIISNAITCGSTPPPIAGVIIDSVTAE